MKKNEMISVKLILKRTMILIFCIVGISSLSSQTVSTFVTGSGLNGPDGFTLDTNENLYVANWGNGSGNTVLKITPDATVTTHVSGLSAPDGLAFDAQGNLFISNYGSDIIKKLEPDGTISDFASGFNNPSDLAFDTFGNLYVSNHGNANGNEVSKITPDGTVTTFATGFNGPVGLVFDNEGYLYVSNYSSGIINKVSPEGEVTVFASIPNSPISRIQYLIFDKDDNLYVPSYGHHKIYIINTQGEVDVFAGTGIPGNTNGSVDSAQFNGPNSIAITDSGVIYVSEYNANRIRKITPEPPVAIDDIHKKEPKYGILLQNFPNPFNGATTISYHIMLAGEANISIYNSIGKEIKVLVDTFKNPGEYSIELNGENFDPGIYYCKMNVNHRLIDSKKLVIIR
ncbi:MAG: T9SS type A sorting domain-containing protein [Bacteroidetes bacterium]|nr:T9SS type A sorting domain-containing protein [Bacteroidota bacterium]